MFCSKADSFYWRMRSTTHNEIRKAQLLCKDSKARKTTNLADGNPCSRQKMLRGYFEFSNRFMNSHLFEGTNERAACHHTWHSGPMIWERRDFLKHLCQLDFTVLSIWLPKDPAVEPAAEKADVYSLAVTVVELMIPLVEVHSPQSMLSRTSEVVCNLFKSQIELTRMRHTTPR